MNIDRVVFAFAGVMVVLSLALSQLPRAFARSPSCLSGWDDPWGLRSPRLTRRCPRGVGAPLCRRLG